MFALHHAPFSGHWLAGLIDAEACFSIGAMNGGQSYSCRMEIAMRADDGPLLESVYDHTGAGRLVHRPCRRGSSHPQVAWIVDRRDECRALVDLLRQHPLRSRKRRDFVLWARAVDVWLRKDGQRAESMHELKEDLELGLRYAPPEDRPVDVPPDWQAFVAYAAGLICGEGHLSLSARKPRLVVRMRLDDRPVLEMLRRRSGVGRIYGGGPEPDRNPTCAWIVYRLDDLESVLTWLTEDVVRGRKGREIGPWSDAICEHAAARMQTRRLNAEVLDDAAGRLLAVRAFRASAPLSRAARRVDTRTHILASLRKCAPEDGSPLRSTEYMERRRKSHPGCPNRNTVTRHFGSWAAALDAAGLPPLTERRQPSRSPVATDAVRSAVLASVQHCADSLGRRPRAMEYFRWRLAADPETPSQATVYALFPGGWRAVLTALDQVT